MSSHSIRIAHLRREPTPASGLAEVWTGLLAMLRARRTRKMLRDMDQHLLADIGIGRGDALMEAARPMWDLRPARR